MILPGLFSKKKRFFLGVPRGREHTRATGSSQKKKKKKTRAALSSGDAAAVVDSLSSATWSPCRRAPDLERWPRIKEDKATYYRKARSSAQTENTNLRSTPSQAKV